MSVCVLKFVRLKSHPDYPFKRNANHMCLFHTFAFHFIPFNIVFSLSISIFYLSSKYSTISIIKDLSFCCSINSVKILYNPYIAECTFEFVVWRLILYSIGKLHAYCMCVTIQRSSTFFAIQKKMKKRLMLNKHSTKMPNI